MESVVVKRQPMDKLSPIEFPPRSNADGSPALFQLPFPSTNRARAVAVFVSSLRFVLDEE